MSFTILFHGLFLVEKLLLSLDKPEANLNQTLMQSLICLSLSAKADARIKFRVSDIAKNEGLLPMEEHIAPSIIRH